MLPKVTIIILNWNNWKDTIECLESLYGISYPNYDVIVVDNGSQDESIEKIKMYAEGKINIESKFFKYNWTNKPLKMVEYTKKEVESISEEIENQAKKLIFIKNERNDGFAEGNNIAIRFALKTLNPDYVLLLNNDTVVDANFLDEMVKVGESEKQVGILGPKIYYYDFDGKDNVIWAAGTKVNKWSGRVYHTGIKNTDNEKYDEIRECNYITGCAMLIKSEALQKLKGFDSIFFAYYEDVDLSTRAIKEGWKNMYVPTSKIWHKVSGSTSETHKKISPTTMYYTTRNCMIYVKKNNNKFVYILFIIYYLTFRHLRRVINFVFVTKDINLFKYYYKGIKDGLDM